MVRILSLLLFALTTVSATRAADEFTPEQAKALAKRFVEAQYAITPVTGEFIVDGTFSEAFVFSREKAAVPRKGLESKLESSERHLRCRWSFDRKRELLDTLEGSKGVSRRFLLDGDSLIDGIKASNMNVDKKRRIPVWRPANFFFLNAGQDRWDDDFTNHPNLYYWCVRRGDTVELSYGWEPRPKYRLWIRESDLVLLSATFEFNGKVLWKLGIEKYHTQGSKVFPTKASIDIYDEKSGGLIRQETMTAVRVMFPDKPEEIRAAFDFTIPKKALLADRQLNGATHIDRPLRASDVLAQPTLLKLRPFSERPPSVETLTATVGEPDQTDQEIYWKWALIGFISLVSANIVYFAIRRIVRIRTANSPTP